MTFSRLVALHELKDKYNYQGKFERLCEGDLEFIVSFIREHDHLSVEEFNGEIRVFLQAMIHGIDTARDGEKYNRALLIDDLLIAINILYQMMNVRDGNLELPESRTPGRL